MIIAFCACSPDGEKLNSYGEANTFTLPNSKLLVMFSTKYFRMVNDGDPPELEANIRIGLQKRGVVESTGTRWGTDAPNAPAR